MAIIVEIVTFIAFSKKDQN